MINYWYFNDWLYSPRTAEELSPELGGGVPWRQGPHQMDILRTIAGGMVRSVRAVTSVWDPQRPVAGSYSSFIEFEDGVVATAVYSGHDHFNSKEFTYQVGSGNVRANPLTYARSRRGLREVGVERRRPNSKKPVAFGVRLRDIPRLRPGF